MPIPRPKILTRFTVPTGAGADWRITFTLSNAVQWDTSMPITLNPGDYYVSADWQSDDVFNDIMTSCFGSLALSGFADHNILFYIDETTHKVKVLFDGFEGATQQDVRMQCGAEIAKVLGFSTDLQESTGSDNPTFTGDYQHGWGWYADEDGLLLHYPTEPIQLANAMQSRSFSGKIKTQLITDFQESSLALQFVTREKMYSRDAEYGNQGYYPYSRNEGLENWYHAVKDGTPFRVYRNAFLDTDRAATSTGTSDASTSSTLTDNDISLATDPQRHVGGILFIPLFYEHAGIIKGAGAHQAIYISSHTATVFTAPNVNPYGFNLSEATTSYYVFDHLYDEWVLNTREMSRFEPRERDFINRYDIEIPLLKYVA